ncbi:MAG: acylphosphatase [Candidatus Thermoplasmatota archaeon]|jgi:acylphosphatase|nr:acylphosphatase [Candidatus Thermoplasmatota archaeon]MCL5790291.1 acylphosphatase [Candidatus Thermoplasmatota archaeon]
MQCNVKFYGIVQGVGFRERTRRMAKGLNLRGWVRNLKDGSVEAAIQGEPDMVEKLIQYCISDIPNAMVTEVKKKYVEEEDFDNFRIIK